jgi:hypothetical protein
MGIGPRPISALQDNAPRSCINIHRKRCCKESASGKNAIGNDVGYFLANGFCRAVLCIWCGLLRRFSVELAAADLR